jgi:fatty-acid desaturase
LELSKQKAIDLMIEDLHTKHHEIRSEARSQGCEYELDNLKNMLIDYLNDLRTS